MLIKHWARPLVAPTLLAVNIGALGSAHMTDDFFRGEVTGIYWLQVYVLPVFALSSFPLLPVLVIIVVFAMSKYLFPRREKVRLIYAVVLLALLAAYSFVTLPRLLDRVHHEDSIHTGKNVFYVGSIAPLETATIVPHGCWGNPDPACIEFSVMHEYVIFKCGWFGVLCHAIEHKTFPERLYLSHGSLSYNASSRELILSVNGTPRATYPVD